MRIVKLKLQFFLGYFFYITEKSVGINLYLNLLFVVINFTNFIEVLSVQTH